MTIHVQEYPSLLKKNFFSLQLLSHRIGKWCEERKNAKVSTHKVIVVGKLFIQLTVELLDYIPCKEDERSINYPYDQ